MNSLRRLGRIDEIDAFREAVVAVHQGNWRLLQAAAESFAKRRSTFRGLSWPGNSTEARIGETVGGWARTNAIEFAPSSSSVQGMDRARSDPDRGAVGRDPRRSRGQTWVVALKANPGGSRALMLWMCCQTTTTTPTGTGTATRPGPPSGPTARRSIINEPESFTKARNDGQCWRWCPRRGRRNRCRAA